MLGNTRKTIGVFITQVHREFQDLLCRGICSRAYDLGYNVAIFSNYLGYDELMYDVGERDIAKFPIYEDLDGIIIIPDTKNIKDFIPSIIDNIEKYSNCPVVSVKEMLSEYYNVLFEEDTALDDIILHFIKNHKYTKINFLTGPKETEVSNQRLSSYRRILEEHGIPIEEDRIYYGDFWKNAAEDAVEGWFVDPQKRPEAIICANDFMAISVCNALAKRGILVPKDIAVSGCDNISISMDFTPSITTVGMPVFDMGMKAVDKIHLDNQGIAQESNSYLKSITYLRESCGCKTRDSAENIIRRRNHLIDTVEDKDKSIFNNANMSISLTGTTTLDDLSSKLSEYIHLNEGFSSFYLCLLEEWDKDEVVFGTSEDVTMEIGFKKGVLLQKAYFNIKDLLPTIYMDEEPQFFYFNMLHHQEKCYGYTAISFERFQAYKPSYQGWLINVCNALENIKTHNALNRLVYKLEDMSIKDELTGLYNRRALQTLGQKYLKQSIKNNSSIMVFSADMDNLKYINDNYGHSKGDIAIKIVADSLMNASEDDEICLRMGGDEYSVIGVEYDNNKMAAFVRKFEDAINMFNQDPTYDFKISISYGWSIILAKEDTDLEECLSLADSRMYQQKYEKAEKRFKHKDTRKD